MITGSLESDVIQISNYNSKYFNLVIETIKKTDFSGLEDGKYYLDNESFFYLLTTYKTKKIEESLCESHRLYIDFQYVIYGEELIGYANSDSIKRSYSEYDFAKDIEFFRNVESESFFILKKDMFAIFYPYEIHRPGISYLEIRSVRKAVFKILVKDQI